MSHYRSHRLASCACFAPCALLLTSFAAANPEPPVREDFIKCNVLDPEIFNHVFAYHEAQTAENPMASTGKLMIGLLKGNPGLPPYNEAKVFLWGPNDDVDPEAVLPPLGDTSNGPAIGFDGTEGYEVVYTKQDNDGNWIHARAAANQCTAGPAHAACFEVLDFDNDEMYENRWSPWVTQNVEVDPPVPAKITYTAADDPSQLQTKRKAFRVLEGTDVSDEIIIAPNGGTDVATVGHWARVDNKDYIISTLGSPNDTVVDVVLYDPDDPQTAISLTDTNDGKYSLGWIGFDPQAGEDGQHTLVTVRTDETEHTWLAVFQKDGLGIDDWVFRYEFDAYTADPGLADSESEFHVTSPEPFQYGDFLYIAFVVADAPDFGSASVGNIMLTRVESEDTEPENYHFRILNPCDEDADCDPTTVPDRKRIEPEIHFMPSRNPAVYYTWVADDTYLNCDEHEHKLMRTFTGLLWVD